MYALTTVADEAFYQLESVPGIEGASLVGEVRQARTAAALNGIAPEGTTNKLAWLQQDASGNETSLHVGTVSDGRATTSTRVLVSSSIYVLRWLGACKLVVRDVEGLFVVDPCGRTLRIERLLTAAQDRAIYNPARFGVGPGIFAFALTRDALHGPEDVIVVRTQA